MGRRGLAPRADPGETDTLLRDQPLLAELYGASVAGRVAVGPRAGRPLTKLGDELDAEDLAALSGPRCAVIARFSVHPNVCVPAHERLRLERWERYAGRPPLAMERLRLLPDSRLLSSHAASQQLISAIRRMRGPGTRHGGAHPGADIPGDEIVTAKGLMRPRFHKRAGPRRRSLLSAETDRMTATPPR
jgi:hypothetical protein